MEMLALSLYTLLAFLTLLVMLLLNLVLAPRESRRGKRVGFECGQKPLEWRWTAFPVEYFPYALIYIAYAVIGVIAFLSALTITAHPELVERVLVFLAALSVGALYLGATLRRLPQRLWSRETR